MNKVGRYHLKTSKLLKKHTPKKEVILPRAQEDTISQWFLTGGTCTPWGYETPKQGLRSTKIFMNTPPEN